MTREIPKKNPQTPHIVKFGRRYRCQNDEAVAYGRDPVSAYAEWLVEAIRAYEALEVPPKRPYKTASRTKSLSLASNPQMAMNMQRLGDTPKVRSTETKVNRFDGYDGHHYRGRAKAA